MLIRSRNMFYSPDAGGGAPAAATETPVAPVTPEAEISEQEAPDETPVVPAVPPKRGKKPAAPVTEAAPEPPVTPAAPDHSEELATLKAKIAELEAGTGTAKSTIAEKTEALAAYSAFAAEQAQQMLDTAPEFVQNRVKMNAENPLATIKEIIDLAEVYLAAKAAAKAEEDAAKSEEPAAKPAGSASAPPPAAGPTTPRHVSMWEQAPPPGPISTRGRTKR